MNAAKAIKDLDDLVVAMLATLALSKPWQRQLAIRLDHASRLMQVLRLTISLEREDAEISDAAAKLLLMLRQTQAQITASRADDTTRKAIGLAVELAHQIDQRVGEYLLGES